MSAHNEIKGMHIRNVYVMNARAECNEMKWNEMYRSEMYLRNVIKWNVIKCSVVSCAMKCDVMYIVWFMWVCRMYLIVFRYVVWIMHACMRMRVCMHACMYSCMHACIHVWMHPEMRVWTHACLYTYGCIQIKWAANRGFAAKVLLTTRPWATTLGVAEQSFESTPLLPTVLKILNKSRD